MLKLTIFHGSPCCAATTIRQTAPNKASPAPTRWVMLLKRSPWYIALGPRNVHGGMDRGVANRLRKPHVVVIKRWQPAQWRVAGNCWHHVSAFSPVARFGAFIAH